MSDIFISYASQERHRVLPLVDALEKTGWSVFWDRTIPAGKTWRQVIGAEIRTCRSVLVVWTESSVTSEWVLEEAETGKRKQILIPVLLDEVEPPFGFGNIQAANLAAWNGEYSSAAFTRLVADIATILGPAPTEAEERRPSEGTVRRGTEHERVRQQELQRSEEEAQREDEAENQKRVEQETNRGRLRDQKQMPSEVKQARKATPVAPRHAREPETLPVPERFSRSNRKQLYRIGLVAGIIGVVVVAFWFFGPSGSKDADVKKIVSLGIQGIRQLNAGEKTMLRAEGRFSDGSKAEVTKNLHWQSSNDSVAAVSADGQVEARKDGSADITAHYGVTASPPLTLVVLAERPSIDRIQEHIKMASSYRDQGEYSTALAELAKAKSLDPVNKAVQEELESTKKACLAEQRIGLTKSGCE